MREKRECVHPLLLLLLLLLYTPFKEALSINALCTFVYIYIWQLSSLRSDCRYLPYSTHFSESMTIFSTEDGQNAKILEVHTKMAADGY